MLVLEIETSADEPVSVDQVKKHAVIEHDEDDAELQDLIASARSMAEAETGRQLMEATLERVLDGFPCGAEIRIPRPPLVEVLSVKYLDPGGTEQTLASTEYVVEAPRGERAPPGIIRLAYGAVWPTTLPVARSVRVRYRAGYVYEVDPEAPEPVLVGAVPAPIRHAIMVGVAESTKNREETIQGTISSKAAMTMARLLGPFRVMELSWE